MLGRRHNQKQANTAPDRCQIPQPHSLDGHTARIARAHVGITIDEITPCLRRTLDGEIVETTMRKMAHRSIPSKSKGWEFDWRQQSQRSGEILGLYAEGDARLQGLLGITAEPAMAAVHVDLAESAPHNNPHNKGTPESEFAGVGPHLFAFAVKRSYQMGYNGCIFFEAKTNLIEHYERTLGAIRLGSSQRMIVEGKAAKRLYDTYFGIDKR